MNKRSLPVGLEAFLWSILLLALGILALWFTKTVLQVNQAVVWACVVLAPFLIYLILAGVLKAVNIPGGFSFELFEASQKQLLDQDKLIAEQVVVGEVFKVEKKAVELLEERPPDDYARYIVLTVTLERPQSYDTRAILHYLTVLSQFRNFKFLVIIDKEGKVFAYISPWQIMRILEKETKRQRDDFAEFINVGYKDSLLRRYDLISQTISNTDTNIKALETMVDLKIDALVVTDKDGMLKGVVEREQILSKLMVAIAKSGS